MVNPLLVFMFNRVLNDLFNLLYLQSLFDAMVAGSLLNILMVCLMICLKTCLMAD